MGSQRLVYILSTDDHIVIPFDQAARWPADFEPERVLCFGRCSKCSLVSLLVAHDPEETEAHERQMGSEVYYAADCWGNCERCTSDLNILVNFSVYNYETFFFDMQCDGCEMTDVGDFETIIDELDEVKTIDEDPEIEAWEKDPVGCAVFIEGPDDKAVIQEFLSKLETGLPSSMPILVEGLGGGGRDRAVESAKYISRISTRVHRKIPYLIVLDGDSYEWAKTVGGIDPDALFVLSKKEIDSYLFDTKAIAAVCKVPESRVAGLMKGSGKEQLEYVLNSLAVRPRPEVKQLIARHIENVPEDFVKMREKIRQIVAKSTSV